MKPTSADGIDMACQCRQGCNNCKHLKIIVYKISCQIADNTHLDWLTKLYNDCCHSFMTTHIQAGNIH